MTSGGPHALLKGFRDSYNITHKRGVFTGTTTHLKTEHALPIAPRLIASMIKDHNVDAGWREGGRGGGNGQMGEMGAGLN